MQTEQEKGLRQKKLHLKKTEQLKRRAECTLAKSKPKQQTQTSRATPFPDDTSSNSSKKFYTFCFLAISFALFAASGPPIVLHEITQAISESDIEQLEERIDYDQLRANVAIQLAQHIQNSDLPQKIEQLLEPSTLGSLAHSSDTSSAPPSLSYFLKNATYSIESVNKVKATVLNKEQIPSTFILRYSGFSWKLVNIILPENTSI